MPELFNILLAYLLAFSYGRSPQTSKLDGKDTQVQEPVNWSLHMCCTLESTHSRKE